MPSRCLTFSCLLWLVGIPAFSQISPPGLDETNAAAWGAIGFSQNLRERWSVTAYVGASRQSNPDDYHMMFKPAIVVLNEETQFKFNKLFAASLCVSLRKQHRYEDTPPYEADSPEQRGEFRIYSRFYYRPSIGRASFAISFRPEYRTYHYQNEDWTPVNKELRFRLKGQVTYSLRESKADQIIVADEVLTAMDHVLPEDSWTELEYTENRLSTYFRHTFSKPRLIFDIGAMHQFRSDGQYIIHAAFDFIFVDPFGKMKPRKRHGPPSLDGSNRAWKYLAYR
jgi:hypothetical protein